MINNYPTIDEIALYPFIERERYMDISRLGFLCVLVLGACVAPEPDSQISLRQGLEISLEPETIIALSVDTAVAKAGPLWSKDPVDVASDLQGKLRFQLVESGLVHQVVEPDAEAAHDLSVTITAFRHDVSGLPGGDDSRLNSLTANVVLTDRANDRQLVDYDVSARAGSEAAYGTIQDGVGIDAMLDAAADGILGGLRGSSGAVNVSKD